MQSSPNQDHLVIKQSARELVILSYFFEIYVNTCVEENAILVLLTITTAMKKNREREIDHIMSFIALIVIWPVMFNVSLLDVVLSC